MAGQKDYADELKAMAAIMEALAPLDREAQIGVLQWVSEKLGLRLPVSVGGDRAPDREADDDGSGARATLLQTRPGTINTVASKLSADSCRTVLIAAAVHMTLFQGKESFSRSEMVSLARSAKVWKSDYTNQTSTMINRLADASVLVEKGKDLYFLSDEALKAYRVAVE